MTNGNNPSRGNRPIRASFNGIVIAILVVVAVAMLLTLAFVMFKGKKMKVMHKSEAARVLNPLHTRTAGGARIADRLRASYL